MLPKQRKGTSRKHFTKPFTQPAAPDCTCATRARTHLVYSDEHAGHVVLAGHDSGQLPLEVDHVADLLMGAVMIVVVAFALIQKGDDAREVFEERRSAFRVGVTVELLRGESYSSCKRGESQSCIRPIDLQGRELV